MLIRSQDKESIINLDNIMRLSIEIPPCSTGERMIMGNGAELGTYSTEEKAIKVLDMIQKEYCRSTELDHNINAGILFCVPKNRVFQMPQDSGV